MDVSPINSIGTVHNNNVIHVHKKKKKKKVTPNTEADAVQTPTKSRKT